MMKHALTHLTFTEKFMVYEMTDAWERLQITAGEPMFLWIQEYKAPI